MSGCGQTLVRVFGWGLLGTFSFLPESYGQGGGRPDVTQAEGVPAFPQVDPWEVRVNPTASSRPQEMGSNDRSLLLLSELWLS